MQDDAPTVIALAILASCAVAVDHEVLGHGTACLAERGRITLASSVYFACTARSTWVAAGGPLGNLAVSTLAWICGRSASPRRRNWQLFLTLVTAFGFFWEAGYLWYGVVTGAGDWAETARSLLGGGTEWWRLVAAGAGGGLYVLGGRATGASCRALFGSARGANTVRVLRVAWAAGTATAVAAGLFYGAGRFLAARQAFLEMGAASLPLVLIRPEPPTGNARPSRPLDRPPWLLGLAALVLIVFVLTLGRGLP